MTAPEPAAGVPRVADFHSKWLHRKPGLVLPGPGHWRARHKLGSRQKGTPRPESHGLRWPAAGRERRWSEDAQEQGQRCVGPPPPPAILLGSCTHRGRCSDPWPPEPGPSALPCVCRISPEHLPAEEHIDSVPYSVSDSAFSLETGPRSRWRQNEKLGLRAPGPGSP